MPPYSREVCPQICRGVCDLHGLAVTRPIFVLSLPTQEVQGFRNIIEGDILAQWISVVINSGIGHQVQF